MFLQLFQPLLKKTACTAKEGILPIEVDMNHVPQLDLLLFMPRNYFFLNHDPPCVALTKIIMTFNSILYFMIIVYRSYEHCEAAYAAD